MAWKLQVDCGFGSELCINSLLAFGRIQLWKFVAGHGWAKEQHKRSAVDDRGIDEEEEI